MGGAREPGQMLVISGPSGSGKSTICRRILELPDVVFSVSATTRKKRPREVDGRDYVFVDKQRFRAHIENGDFIEWAEVHGNLYGTLREPMTRALAAGQLYLVEIDVQGGAQLKALEVPGEYVFIAPPDMETLEARLRGRGTDAPEEVERRLRKAREEMESRDKYDHIVSNDDLEQAVAEVLAIVGREPAPRNER